jgi:hypothetical protein
MKLRLKTALIGTGFVGRVHLENLLQSGCAEVAALVTAPVDLIRTGMLAAQFVTGHRITALCADLKTFHRTRRQPVGSLETFAVNSLQATNLREAPIETEDFGAVVFRMGERTRGSFTANQTSAGRKNRV